MNMRLQSNTGEWINRTKKIKFSFEGKEYEGFEGDTISSALWAAGEKVLGRSFKYHRPRGIFTLANHDVNIMVTDGVDTNIRADVIQIQAGMALEVVNVDGGVKADKKRFLDLISAFLPVGFYYKAFHTPRSLFPFWERIIRNAAGLGVVNFNYPRLLKQKQHSHYDILVVGAGPSGLSAALTAAGNGLKVLLVDENQKIGGSFAYDNAGSNHHHGQLNNMVAEVMGMPNVTVKTGAYAAGYYSDHLIPIVEDSGITKIRAGAVVVASGAFEQPPVFRNNDLPGVMLGSAAQRLIARYGVKPFQTGVVVTANSYGYRVALDLLASGVAVAAVLDMRAGGETDEIAQTVANKGIKIHKGACIYEAVPLSGKVGVKGAIVAGYDEVTAQADIRKPITIDCDGIVMCAGWAPAAALLYQAGTGMQYDNEIHQFRPSRLPDGIFAAGKVNGVFGLHQRLQDGARAASEALKYLGHLGHETTKVERFVGSSPSHPYPVVMHPKGKNFVDFDEDISVKDFIHAAQEGFDNIELMKRFTTVGMGPSQGKHSNMNAIRILARIRNLPVNKIGTTTARPFFHPTPVGHLAGRGLHPQRHTPLHQWHSENGAEFIDAGAWKRPAYYKIDGKTKDQSIQRETNAVRNSAGIIDVSTLGKIELHGTGAADFLERFYTGSFKDQRVGRSRYALMLDESGVMVDDGVACRITENFFYVTTGTSNTAAVYREMQRWNQIWGLDVTFINVTGAYGAINIAGPLAGKTLQGLTAFDLSEDKFLLGDVADIHVGEIKARLIRVGFVSNKAYEIHVPTASVLKLWTLLLQTGNSARSVTAFGTDAQRLLRLEMGHPLVGHDTDGLTNPFEVGAEWAINLNKPFFIGQRSLQIIKKRPQLKKLVSFSFCDGYQGEVPFECNLVIDKSGHIEGRITSISYSPSLRKFIGFAYVSPSNTKVGTVLSIRTDSGQMVEAAVVKSPFIEGI